MTNAKKITLGGLFLALGILLPQVAHLIAGPSLGQVLLPMHIPVLLGGFVLGPWFGCFLGAATPLISSLITGMPQAPRLWFMVIELLCYGLFAGLLYKKLRLPSIPSLIIAMVAGRAAYFLSLVFTLNVLGLEIKGITSAWAATAGAVISGWPGIIAQLIIIPAALAVLLELPITSIRKAKKNLKAKNCSAALVNRQKNIAQSSFSRGVKPILDWLHDEGAPLDGAFVADKVIGKAAALLMVKGGVKKVYGEVISAAAEGVFESHRLPYSYKTKVPYIINRVGDGMCPMENAVKDIADPDEAEAAVLKALDQLKKQSETVAAQ